MIPEKPLPYSDEFSSPDEYVEAILHFAREEHQFLKLAGGIHLLDFFTGEQSLFEQVLPQDWQPYILSLEPMAFVDLLLRQDLDALPAESQPPESLAKYIRDVRRLLLRRGFAPQRKPADLKRPVTSGMTPKKIHEVTHFADYLDRLTEDVSKAYGKEITHLVDFGSGQNYLGRTLALPPYNRHVIAVEGREHNIEASRRLDVNAGLATLKKVQRNKKMWLHVRDSKTSEERLLNNPKAQARAANAHNLKVDPEADLRPPTEIPAEYLREEGKGSVSYVISRLDSGDLSDVIPKIKEEVLPEEFGIATTDEGEGKSQGECEGEEATTETNGMEATKMESRQQQQQQHPPHLMAVSIHSCGNLSHYGIRSLIMNPDVHAVAIVGCCYNLLTEKLGPPTYKFPYIRPTLQAVNGRLFDESHRFDPQGFPISQRLSTYRGDGVRFNVTARMMACQAPSNWTQEESPHFFMRNLYRATLQRMLLDRGVIKRLFHRKEEENEDENAKAEVNGGDDDNKAKDGSEGEGKEKSFSPFDASTDPVILGSLNKKCYDSLRQYVRGAVKKLSTHREWNKYSGIVQARMADITDEEIDAYEREYMSRGREVAAIWSLMAFSAGIVESLIATDRWLFLREHPDVVRDCWVETVFDYKQSPRNMVVVGIKR